MAGKKRPRSTDDLDIDDTDSLFGEGSDSGPEWAMAAGMSALSVGAGTLAGLGFPHWASIGACAAAAGGFYYTQQVYGSPDTRRSPSLLAPVYRVLRDAAPGVANYVPVWLVHPGTAYERSASADVIGLGSSAILTAGNALSLHAARAAGRPTGVFTQLVAAGALSAASFGYRTAMRAAVLESEGAGAGSMPGRDRGSGRSSDDANTRR